MHQQKQLQAQLEHLKWRITWLARGADFAEDLYQEVALICLQASRSIDWDQDQTGFILRAARNRWVDHLRAALRQKTHLIRYAQCKATVSAAPDIAVEREERSSAVHRAIADLPTRYREAICRLIDIDAQPDAGRSTGVCHETWRTRQKRALRRMASNPRLRYYAPESWARPEPDHYPILSRDSHV